jgi:hypothetical protein
MVVIGKGTKGEDDIAPIKGYQRKGKCTIGKHFPLILVSYL